MTADALLTGVVS